MEQGTLILFAPGLPAEREARIATLQRWACDTSLRDPSLMEWLGELERLGVDTADYRYRAAALPGTKRCTQQPGRGIGVPSIEL